ncbi:hypothetical protein ACFSQT_17715 [Mesorhizobium calcicola]|uniref:Uncharacterized protein n=1 Tax=Mesorhizobium calcicola TaxID=1300310 RepID=A0ABW4WFM1_9HYPH
MRIKDSGIDAAYDEACSPSSTYNATPNTSRLTDFSHFSFSFRIASSSSLGDPSGKQVAMTRFLEDARHFTSS